MLVQSVTELQHVQHRINTETSFVMPIFVDQHAHPSTNTLSSLHILIDTDYYCIPINHPDAISMNVTLDTAYDVVTLYKREILHSFKIPQERVHDLATILQLSRKVVPEVREYYTPIITRMMQQFQFKNLHLSVPLMVWMNYGQRITQFLRESFYTEIPDAYDFVSNTIIPTLTTIEKSGIYVDTNVLYKHYPDVKKYVINNTVYSEYNPYTVTGRPSNKYGGINFAALNKHDGIRSAFTSRHGEDGLLIQLDYEAFHLRLVGAQINYTLPNSSVHTYLAQQYYGKQEVTPEEYEQSKARTFALMYGMTDDFGGVEFFHKVRKYSDILWQSYKTNGYIKTKTGKRIVVDDPSQNKVFNYLVQWLETEEAMSRVSNVCNLLTDKLTKPILYTYDALLLDLHRSETALLPRIKYLMEEGGFPTRMYKGKNYDELIPV